MAQLPTDRDSADDALNDNHDDHHNVLHATHNALDALGAGQVLVGTGSGWVAQAKLPTKAEVDALSVNAATLGGSTLAEILAQSQVDPITITGDGTATSFDVTHNLGTRSVEWYFEDANNAPLKVSSWVPTTGNELNSSTISIPGPIANAAVVSGYVSRAGATATVAATEVSAYYVSGAAANGTTDDTAVIQAAINSLPTYGVLDGENKTYMVNNLWLKSQMTIRNFRLITAPGSQTDRSPINIGHDLSDAAMAAVGQTNTADSTAAYNASIASPGLHDIVVDNVHIDGNRTNQTNVDYLQEGAGNAPRDGGRHGFSIKGYSTNITIRNSSAQFCATDGILVYRGLHTFLTLSEANVAHVNMRLENCRFNWNRRHGGAGESISGLNVISCELNDNGQTINGGVTIGDQGAEVPAGEYGNGWDMEGYGLGSHVTNIHFSHCEALRNVRDGILFFDPTDAAGAGFVPRDNIRISDCHLDAGTNNLNGEFCLTFTPSIGNKANGASYTNVIVADNHLEGGITFRSCDNALVVGNVQTLATATQRASLDYATNVRFAANNASHTAVSASNSTYQQDEAFVVSQAWEPGEIAAGGTAVLSIAVPNAIGGDFVQVGHTAINTTALAPLIVTGHVVFPNASVRVVIHNPTAGALTVPSGTLHVSVRKATA